MHTDQNSVQQSIDSYIKNKLSKKEEIRIKKERIKASKLLLIYYLTESICDHLRIEMMSVIVTSRKRSSVYPRQLCFYFIRDVYASYIAYPLIAFFFKKDHSTVMHGIDTIKDLSFYNENKKEIDKLKKHLSSFYESAKQYTK